MRKSPGGRIRLRRPGRCVCHRRTNGATKLALREMSSAE
ncbi:hypothetical protein PUN28_004874 [Cardiocondyla obscurior]|uniref:Ribosomal protein L34 n=1 Tax=Cardiocondyla obscurior TaxID=286306 RepID=A0AAW2GFL8_9HYME